jgi:hypothetical protein
MLQLSQGGKRPTQLFNGESRVFLQDGGTAGRRRDCAAGLLKGEGLQDGRLRRMRWNCSAYWGPSNAVTSGMHPGPWVD